MPDPIIAPPVDSTGQPAGVGQPTTPPAQPVNPGQTQGSNPTDTNSLIIASYEQRLSRLMSEKDKALNERNQAIAQLADLQKTYTTEKDQTANSLTNTANAAQAAIEARNTLEAQLQQVQSELLRAKVLLAEPDLAQYEQFIPATNDAEKLAQAVAQLKTIRAQDHERQRAAYGLPAAQQQQAPQVPGVPPVPGTLPSQAQQLGALNLYANRPTMAPAIFAPGSQPAQMNPNGAGDPMTAITDLLRAAASSGDSTKYAEALEQAKLLAGPLVQAQMGR